MSNRQGKGSPMRKFSAEGEQLAPVVFGVKPDESQVTTPPGMVSTPEPESITTIKERLQKALDHMKSTTTDEELVGLISESNGAMKQLKSELEDLQATREFQDRDLYKLAESSLQEQIALAVAAIQAAIRRQPSVMAKIGEANRRAQLATELTEKLPDDPTADLTASEEAFTNALKRALEGKVFFNPSSNNEAHGRLPMPYRGNFYAPVSGQDEVIYLFDALCNFRQEIEKAKTQRREERNEAAAGYVVREDEIEARAAEDGEEIVSFLNLLTKPGMGRLALVTLAYGEGRRPIGKAVITRREGNRFVAVRATTTPAAEMLFLIPRRNEKGEVSFKWLPERELRISFKDGKPDFSGIDFEPIRKSLEFAYDVAIHRKDGFQKELDDQRKILEAGSGNNLEDLPAGRPGIYPIHIFDWRTGRDDDKTAHLVFSISSDGESFIIMSATPGTLRAAPFINEYLGRAVPKNEFLNDKRLWAICAKASEAEVGRRVNALLKSNPEMTNIRKDSDGFSQFITKQPGHYFFSFFWREGQGKYATSRGVNAHLQVGEDGTVTVVEAIGKFSEEFFRDLIASPKLVDQINGRPRGALRSMARNHFGQENIPAFLLDTQTAPETKATVETPTSSPAEPSLTEATDSASI